MFHLMYVHLNSVYPYKQVAFWTLATYKDQLLKWSDQLVVIEKQWSDQMKLIFRDSFNFNTMIDTFSNMHINGHYKLHQHYIHKWLFTMLHSKLSKPIGYFWGQKKDWDTLIEQSVTLITLMCLLKTVSSYYYVNVCKIKYF